MCANVCTPNKTFSWFPRWIVTSDAIIYLKALSCMQMTRVCSTWVLNKQVSLQPGMLTQRKERLFPRNWHAIEGQAGQGRRGGESIFNEPICTNGALPLHWGQCLNQAQGKMYTKNSNQNNNYKKYLHRWTQYINNKAKCKQRFPVVLRLQNGL